MKKVNALCLPHCLVCNTPGVLGDGCAAIKCPNCHMNYCAACLRPSPLGVGKAGWAERHAHAGLEHKDGARFQLTGGNCFLVEDYVFNFAKRVCLPQVQAYLLQLDPDLASIVVRRSDLQNEDIAAMELPFLQQPEAVVIYDSDEQDGAREALQAEGMEVENDPAPADDAAVQEPEAPAAVQEPEAPAAVQEPEAPAAVQGPEAPAAVQEPEAPAAVQEPEAPAAVQEPEAPAAVQEPEAPAAVQEPEAPAAVQEPEAPPGMWICNECTSLNNNCDAVCLVCFQQHPEPWRCVQPGAWECRNCTVWNVKTSLCVVRVPRASIARDQELDSLDAQEEMSI